MSDDDPTLTPEQEREVRRLLADARHAEPVPGDVAARLDRVLAELARGDSGPPTPVTVLATRRRQRVVSLLVAAAAVVVIGIGLGQVVGRHGGGVDDAGSAAADSAAEASGASPSPKDGSAGADALTGDQAADAPRYALKAPARLDPDRFSRGVIRLRELAGAAYSTQYASPTPATGASGASGASDRRGGLSDFLLECPPAHWGAGTFVPVRYAGDPAVLVFRRADGDTQVVDLFQCGSVDVIRSITLPAP
ncbi:MAG: hypothetical protein JWN22_548 [Nocardioides sp.]|nr:hypothetical protein [Nocardioides sp.]